MTYQVIHCVSTHCLEECVNKAIAAGWKPQGGIAAHGDGHSWLLLQAMVKE